MVRAARHASSRRLAAAVAVLGATSGFFAVTRSFVGSPSANGPARKTLTIRNLFGGAPAGRDTPIPDRPAADAKHFIQGTPMYPPWPEGMEEVMLGMGCFWCSDNLYMKMEGIYSTQVGYAGGENPNPSYQDICTGQTGHAEVVRVVYDPKVISFAEVLKVFWERHNPTTLNQQGGDRGTQYRSAIFYYNDEQKALAEKTAEQFQQQLGGNAITTQIAPAPEFFYAEDYHQQYDAKPGNRQYCGLSPTGKELDISAL